MMTIFKKMPRFYLPIVSILRVYNTKVYNLEFVPRFLIGILIVACTMTIAK